MTCLQIIVLLLVLLCQGLFCIALLSGLISRLSRRIDRLEHRERRERAARDAYTPGPTGDRAHMERTWDRTGR